MRKSLSIKQIGAFLLAMMMLMSLLPTSVFAEEPETAPAEEPAATEQAAPAEEPAPAPAAEEPAPAPAAEEPAPAPAAEEPAPAPAAEEPAEAPAAEEPAEAPAAEEPAEAPAAEEPAEAPAAEEPAEAPAAEEPAEAPAAEEPAEAPAAEEPAEDNEPAEVEEPAEDEEPAEEADEEEEPAEEEEPEEEPKEEENKGPFTVTYKAVGGGKIYNPYSGTTTQYDDRPIEKGGYITGATAFTPDGYAFDGWFYEYGGMITGQLRLDPHQVGHVNGNLVLVATFHSTQPVEAEEPAEEEVPAEEPAEEEIPAEEPAEEEVPAEEPAEEEIPAEEPTEKEVPAEEPAEEEELVEIEDYETPLGLEGLEAEEIEPKEFTSEDLLTEEDLPDNAVFIDTLLDELNEERSIDIYYAFDGDELNFGDEVTLYAVLKGYDNCVFTVQWQQSPDDAAYSDVAGAFDLSYHFIVTEENYEDYWRVEVTITAVEVPDELLTPPEADEVDVVIPGNNTEDSFVIVEG